MDVRIGELLTAAGVLKAEQVQAILDQQQITGKPFGLLCEELFSVDAAAIEEAWAQQYARLTRVIDPTCEVFEESATELVTRRQAWQFRVLPIRYDGGDLMMATTQQYLRRALGFAVNVIGVPVFLVLAEPDLLGQSLCQVYPLPGMTPGSVLDRGLDRLLAMVSPERSSGLRKAG